MLSHRKGVLLDGIGSELVRSSVGGARKTLSKWLGDLSNAITLGDVASTFTSGDATPSVLDNSKFITAGSTAITNFDDGVEGQTITIYRGASDISIADNATIDPIIAGTLTLTSARPSVTFRLASGVWKQVEEAGALSSAMAPVVQLATIPLARVALGFDADLDAFWTAADVAAARTALALGTAALEDVSTGGAGVALLEAANTWPATQTFTVPPVFTDAAGTLGALGIGISGSVAGANTWAALQQFDGGILFKTSGHFKVTARPA